MKHSATIYLLKVNNRNTKKDVKYVQIKQKKQQKDVNDVVLVFLFLTLDIFHTFFLMVLWLSLNK